MGSTGPFPRRRTTLLAVRVQSSDDSLDATYRLYEALSERFGAGAVLMDMDAIPPGADFRRFLVHKPAGTMTNYPEA